MTHLPAISPHKQHRVRSALGNGEIEAANAMLGRPYRLTGTVVHGKRLGRTIGFPTANIATEPHMAIPAPGVYAVDVRIGNESIWHSAMANIGHRPTVDTAPGAHHSDRNKYFRFRCRHLRKHHRGGFPEPTALRTHLPRPRFTGPRSRCRPQGRSLFAQNQTI